jgi:hypothetical protein
MNQIIGGTNAENEEVIKLYVKKIFTTNTKTYFINVNAPLKDIMSYILNNAENHFQMEGDEPKELVASGQSIPGVKSEDAPAIELENPGETFKQRFGDRYTMTAFYIRTAGNRIIG